MEKNRGDRTGKGKAQRGSEKNSKGKAMIRKEEQWNGVETHGNEKQWNGTELPRQAMANSNLYFILERI